MVAIADAFAHPFAVVAEAFAADVANGAVEHRVIDNCLADSALVVTAKVSMLRLKSLLLLL